MRQSRLTHQASLALLAGSCAATPAMADAEWHVGLQPALAARSVAAEPKVAFHGGLELDVLFGREHSGSVGFGPSLEIGTWAFSDLRSSLLGLLVVPVGPLDFGTALGPQWQHRPENELALAGRLFVGYRAFNHSGAYGTGVGVFVGVDQPATFERGAWLLGLHFDGMWLSLPFIAGASLLRGTPDE